MALKIIWLCSWYPSDADNFIGDFVQRQAIATSTFAKIDVVHIAEANKHYSTTNIVNQNLTETIIYIPKSSKINFFLNYKKTT